MKKMKSSNNIAPVVILLLLSHLFFSHPLPAQSQGTHHELFLVAQRAFDDGFHDVAIRYIEQYLEKHPAGKDLVQIKLLLGQCYFFKNQYLKAYSIFKELLAYEELKDATYFWLGETYFKASDYNQAAQYYQQVLDEFPKSEFIPQAQYSLGWALCEKGLYKKAGRHFHYLITHFPNHTLTEDAYFKLGECEHNEKNYAQAIDYFQKYLNKYPEARHQPESFFYLAESYFYTDDFLTATTYYAKAADLAEDAKLVYMAQSSMGWCYLKLDKKDLSKRYFLEAEDYAIKHDVLTDDVYWGLATLYSQFENFHAALDVYNNLIKLFPESPNISDAYLGKANIYYSQEDYPSAIREYSWIIEHYKNTKENQGITEKAYYGLAWTYLKSGDLKKSIDTFQRIISQTNSDIVKMSALTQMGDAYLDSGKLKDAISIYDKILNDYPDSAYADYVQFRLGIALLQSQRLDTAALSFKSLLNNFPESKYTHEALYFLGLTYFKKNKMTSSVDFLSRYIEDDYQDKEHNRDAYFLLGLAYFNLKDYQSAIETFQTIQDYFDKDFYLMQVSALNIAKCLYHMGRDQEAISKFKSVIQDYSETESALESLLWLGDYHLERREFPQAIQYYQKALDNFPSTPKINIIYFELGQTYTAMEEFDSAIDYYQRITKEASPEVYGKAQLAIADIFSKNLPLEEALETYVKIGEVSHEFKCDAYLKIAGIYKSQEQYQKAIQALEFSQKNHVARCEYSEAQLQFAIADHYELLNLTDKAIEEYFKIPYLYSNEINWIIKAYLRIGRLFEDQENWEEAQIVYNKILEYHTEESKYAEERIHWIRSNISEKR